MNSKVFGAFLALSLLLVPAVNSQTPGLQVSYGSAGIQRLAYNGTNLEDMNSNPSDGFHIWHMKATDLSGNLLTGDQYGWGEVNNGRTWNPSSHSWTYSFKWGFISVQFNQSGDTLNMNVTTHNNSNSGIIFDGAVIYPFVLRFPQLPAGFTDPNYEHLAFNTTGPSVTVADFGTGQLASVLTDATKPLYTGFEPAGTPNAYFPVVSGTALDGMATFFPRNDRPVMPGATDAYTVSLRFAASGTAVGTFAADAYANWAAAWPSQLNWPDRRIIGTVFLASSAVGTPNQPAGYANNPRRYYNNSNSNEFDVRTPDGIAKFQRRILQQAQSNVQNLTKLNAQGAITWDIEGQQFPHSTSYVCSPDQIAQVAPEMETVVRDSSSVYNGMKLDDAYFKIIRDAGFKVGVCIRPQDFRLYADGSANQVLVPNEQVAAHLIRKIKYAHDRWGATIFYVDSSVDANGAALEPMIFQQVAAAVPDSLVIPEETSPKFFAYTAPFQSFIFHTDLGTPQEVYNYYPHAFSANLVNDVDAGKLAQYRAQLTDSVRHGDILMVHADYWQDNNPTVVQIYKDAGVAEPGPDPAPMVPVPTPTPVTPVPVTPVLPTPVTPVPTPTPVPAPAPTSVPVVPAPAPASPVAIVFPAAGQTVSGTITVTAQVTHTLDAAGSYLILDGQGLDSRRVSSGPYTYLLDTTTLVNGTHTLQIWAHDIGNNTLLSAIVPVSVSNAGVAPAPVAPPVSVPITVVLPIAAPAPPAVPATNNYPIAFTVPGSAASLSGTITGYGVIPQTLSSAGSIVLLDGAEFSRRLANGPYVYTIDLSGVSPGEHTLQLWALDIGNNHLLSNPVPIVVTR